MSMRGMPVPRFMPEDKELEAVFVEPVPMPAELFDAERVGKVVPELVKPKMLRKAGTGALRVLLIVKNFKTSELKVFVNRPDVRDGLPVELSAARAKAVAAATTMRKRKVEFVDNFEMMMTVSLELPEGEHRIAAA